MIVRITVQISMSSREICDSVLESLEPDNVEVPKGIIIEMSCHQSIFIVDVKSEDTSVLTARNTIDDVLVHANLALKTLSSIDMR
ncbi:MAG: KEOPS complex subunit Pcc1 [Ignisphaera sp.]|uniref:KEOPS complex subunit n=1 Tax=Ignisphaera aggregans TaxID=334771 RepID=A0A7C4NTV2_9CREN